VLLEELDLTDVLLQAVGEHPRRLPPHLVEERLCLSESTGDQLGRSGRAGTVHADCGDDDDDTTNTTEVQTVTSEVTANSVVQVGSEVVLGTTVESLVTQESVVTQESLVVHTEAGVGGTAG